MHKERQQEKPQLSNTPCAKPEPTLISVRDSQLQALSQSFPGAKHLAKLKSVAKTHGQA